MVPQFCKISFIVIIFDRFLCQIRFLQSLQWVLIGFSVCSVRFLMRSGGFLLGFLTEKKKTYIWEEHSVRANNKVFWGCANSIVKVS